MRYMLMAAKYNKKGMVCAEFEQQFEDLDKLKRKLGQVLQNYENYTIYEDGVILETNFKDSGVENYL